MTTIRSGRHSSFGTSCIQCGNELIAPDTSEYRIERQVHHVWRCPKCNACFGSLVAFPPDTKSMRDIKTGKVIFPSLFPSLLVAWGG
jgi:ribosomal protein L37AE/L43A